TSLGYFNQKGITKPVDLENFNRFNITQNISYKVNNWITAKANKLYFYPIPTQELVLNPQLIQNAGWQ
ncbi:MAG: RagB/SusD family nutrient uptake outer membrane protein, partial [Bacteroidetes bacterium]|nr:RagB/SusD family nutrient uptake outer membrane protein [Bacteroidota bacterium]